MLPLACGRAGYYYYLIIYLIFKFNLIIKFTIETILKFVKTKFILAKNSLFVRYSPTTTSHTRYTSRVVHACFSVDREIIMRVPTNSHACKLNTCDSYTNCSHTCDIYFLVLLACESRLVTQFYKSNATSALVAG